MGIQGGKNWTKKVILLKAEVTEGTDSVPTEAANALKVLNYRPTFMDAENRVRAFEKAFFGADPVAMAAFKRGFSCDMEIAGSGTNNIAPPWMVPMRFAGFNAGVVTGGNSVVQSPVSVAASASHWSYIDDFLMKAVGGKMSAGFTLEDDAYPLFNFTYLGRPPIALAEEAVPANPTLANYITPALASSEATTFLLDGFALPLRRWEMNANADLQYRSLIGPSDRVVYRDRSWSGTIVAEVPALTDKDYFAKVRPGTTMAAQAIHGTAAGNIVQIDAPALQVTGNIDLSDEQGKLMMTIPVTAIPVTGNDEIVFTSK
jgi:hypothetical protein